MIRVAALGDLVLSGRCLRELDSGALQRAAHWNLVFGEMELGCNVLAVPHILKPLCLVLATYPSLW